MRVLAVLFLVAACGNDTGLLLDVDPGSPDVASVEVFVPKDTAGDGLGLPPNGAGKLAGTIYEVVDSVAAARDSSGRVRILLKPGDLGDVPALLVLGYDGNHTPIASAVVTDPSGSIHLPASTAVEIQVTLAASSYVAPSSAGQANGGVQIARWSANGSGGDLDGPCIAVVSGDGNAFFSADGDLDCDGAEPDCDDTRYRYTAPASAQPMNPLCAAQNLDPATMDACVLGQTISCTDGVGTCSPRMNGGALELPICVPVTVCDNCKNSDDLTGPSGIDPACELAARMDSDTLRVECELAVTQPTGQPTQPCIGSTQLDLVQELGTGWICSSQPGGFLTAFSDSRTPQPLPVGGNSTTPDYLVSTHCSAAPGIGIGFAANIGGVAGPVMGEELGVLVLGVRNGPNMTAPNAILALPFRLTYVPGTTDVCPSQPLTCQLVAPSGDPKNDPMWHCAGR